MDALLLAGYGQILTRTAESDNIHRLHFRAVHIRDAAQMLHVWETIFCHTDREWLNFAGPDRFNAVHDTSQFKPARS